MPKSAISAQRSAISSRDGEDRPRTPDPGPRTLQFGFVFLLLGGPGLTYAQDDVPVPPLQAGTFLTFHPICVHFAIALTGFGLVLDWLGSWRRHPRWQYAGRLSFLAGVVAIGLAGLGGWGGQGFPRPASVFGGGTQGGLLYYEYLGDGVLGVFLDLPVVRLRPAGLP